MAVRVPSALTRELTEDKVTEFESQYQSAVRVLNRIKAECEKKLDLSIKESESKENLGSPNWALVQSDLMGYRRGIRYILDLLPKE